MSAFGFEQKLRTSFKPLYDRRDSWSNQTDSTQVLASNTISNKGNWLLGELEDSTTKAGNTQTSLEHLVRPESVQKTTHNDGTLSKGHRSHLNPQWPKQEQLGNKIKQCWIVSSNIRNTQESILLETNEQVNGEKTALPQKNPHNCRRSALREGHNSPASSVGCSDFLLKREEHDRHLNQVIKVPTSDTAC